MIDRLILALQFLSIIPLKARSAKPKEMAGSLVWFPFVGLLLGLILAGAQSIFYWLGVNPLTADICLVVLLAGLTGGMHLDGLADTFDSLFRPAGKEEILRIMRDPHIGAMGVVSIACALLLKIALLANLGSQLKPLALILMCVFSRWSMVLAMFKFNYARKEGKAAAFMENINYRIFLYATIFTLFLGILIWSVGGLLLFGAIAVFTLLFCSFVQKKISGITGDTLGALLEINEILALAAVFFLAKL